MDLTNQICYRLPPELSGDPCTHVEVYAQNDEMAAGDQQARDVPQALVREHGLHMAQEVVCQDDILPPEHLDQLWISRIPQVPADPFANPGVDRALLSFP